MYSKIVLGRFGVHFGVLVFVLLFGNVVIRCRLLVSWWRYLFYLEAISFVHLEEFLYIYALFCIYLIFLYFIIAAEPAYKVPDEETVGAARRRSNSYE